MKYAFKTAFPKTIPVMAGYIFLGFAFGLLMNDAGFGILWTLSSSLFIYSGTAQFLSVSLLANHASILQAALLTFVLSFRHFFYGLSLIPRYKDAGILKPLLIHTTSDETYAVLVGTEVPSEVEPCLYYFAVCILDQFYWVLGSVLGNTIGGVITIDLTGIDFAMTALFAVLVVEQWKNQKSHIPAISGFLISILAIRILGADNFIIPTLLAVSALLLILKERIEIKEGMEDGE